MFGGRIKNLYEGKIRNLFKGRINLFEVKIRSKITEHEVYVTLLLVIPLIFLFFISFLMGKYPISPQDVLTAFASKIFHVNSTLSPTATAVLFQVRLPRILAAMMVGAALSIAGASFQGLFRNPLVSSDKLGVSAGAGFGAALAIFFSASAMMIQFSAFVWGLVAVALTYSLGRSFKGVSILNLLLCGIAVETFFAALLSMTKYMADPGQLQSIVFWILGSLAKVTNQDVLLTSLPILVGTAILLIIRWRLNILSMGKEEAQTLGVNIKRLRAIIIVCCTVITASAVSICGIIAWVGLVIPHVARMIVGPDNKVLLPASVILGAFFLLLIDDVARTVTTMEIPLGVLTALIGAPFFLYLLKKTKYGWSR
ncbi:ABC-type transporter, integral membrane subunit [Methanobacterium paludis]|uniref:ABC-type transporter, integral membrane subunit n=1 Tax=Methanobacterium paludis (strain DSM 25820 / JCM 18151 / SWAN1) TaxID=868131 RepID=F6D7E9_METPW|nr:ABC-type transporter, integral membrane subunit [Methanobacterium paludis]